MVSDKKEEVSALEMKLQVLDKDLDWKKEVTTLVILHLKNDENYKRPFEKFGFAISRSTTRICFILRLDHDQRATQRHRQRSEFG